MSSLFPLKANEEVRDATRSAWILVKALMMSSATPSLKYSFSASLLMLTKGSTAMDLGPALALSSGGVPVPLGQVSAWANWAAVA